MKKILLLAVCLLSFSAVHASGTIWKIGKADNRSDEFALAPDGFKKFLAKDFGYDPKIMKVVLRLKKLDEADRTELDEMTERYRAALNV